MHIVIQIMLYICIWMDQCSKRWSLTALQFFGLFFDLCVSVIVEDAYLKIAHDLVLCHFFEAH
jgi:hypothetical protein